MAKIAVLVYRISGGIPFRPSVRIAYTEIKTPARGPAILTQVANPVTQPAAAMNK